MKIKLLEHKHIPGFDGGSSVEYHDDNIFLTDIYSHEILVLSPKFKEIERIPLFAAGSTASPDAHRDLQASTVVEINKIPRLLALVTDGAENGQHKAALINLDDRTREDFTVNRFDERLKTSGLQETNITAAAVVLGRLVLANRGSNIAPQNNFVITDIDVWKEQDTEEISLLPVKYPDDAPEGILLTGMCYSPENDWLLLTFTSAALDGSGSGPASYMGLVENASRKVARKQVKINEITALQTISKNFNDTAIKAVGFTGSRAGG
ncbi:MAG: hypothetical protein EOP49_32415 [Sphingobacteriales bacterium]|nr:MAG: hypothetical protein EOP49_32415 [Sphingobacteriales bacterium]